MKALTRPMVCIDGPLNGTIHNIPLEAVRDKRMVTIRVVKQPETCPQAIEGCEYNYIVQGVKLVFNDE